MKDIMNLTDNFVNLKDKTLIVNLPLTIKEFAIIYNQKDKEQAIKELSYVAIRGSYNSDINIKGITGDEAHRAACIKVGLDINIKPTDEMLDAIKYYDKHYSFGVIGIIKELYKSYELTRESVSLINSILYNYQRAIKSKLSGELSDEEALVLNGNINAILTNTAKIREVGAGLESDIAKLKIVEAKVVAVENKTLTPLGGGKIPKSARRSDG